ncbi:MAG: DUF1007 family protein [Pseudomonadota bacterium]
MRHAPRFAWRAGAAALTACVAQPALSHPHVFVDGGVDFIMANGSELAALAVTWRYDAFETLYLLSSYGMSLNADGELDELDRQRLVRHRSDWPDDFDGSAHLSIDGEAVALDWPRDLDAHLVDGRLEVTFLRDLTPPRELSGRGVEVAFYESTYFFAFSVTDAPELRGAEAACGSSVDIFDPSASDLDLQATLAKLSREEIPDIANVGALFADRISVTCG